MITKIKCTDNGGFEDQLTNGEVYDVRLVGQGASDFFIEDDTGVKRWYGECKFEVVG